MDFCGPIARCTQDWPISGINKHAAIRTVPVTRSTIHCFSSLRRRNIHSQAAIFERSSDVCFQKGETTFDD